MSELGHFVARDRVLGDKVCKESECEFYADLRLSEKLSGQRDLGWWDCCSNKLAQPSNDGALLRIAVWGQRSRVSAAGPCPNHIPNR